MRLFDFFRTITTKFKNRDLLRMQEAQFIYTPNTENNTIHENAYINAYTKQIQTKPSNLIKVEENGKILKMKQNDNTLELSRIKRLRESLPVEDGRQIDLYSGILEKNAKKNLVYFGLENELNLKKALEDKNRCYKVSNKMTKMFSIPLKNEETKFIGSLVEDDIYKNYCITRSNRLENYVNKIEERRMKIMEAAQKYSNQKDLQSKNITEPKNSVAKKRGRKSNKEKLEELKRNTTINNSNASKKTKTCSNNNLQNQKVSVATKNKTNTTKKTKVKV